MKFLIFSLILMTSSAFAKNLNEIEGYIGMVSVSYAEQESGLEGPNVSDPAVGTYSNVSSSFAYHFYKKGNWSMYGGAIVPMLSSTGLAYFSGFNGLEYYFNDVPHSVHESSPRLEMYILPKIRYHLNLEFGLNYMTYTSETTKKTDLSFGVGVGMGGSYSFSENWGVKLKTIASKDIGTLTDTMAIKMFIGGIFFLGD